MRFCILDTSMSAAYSTGAGLISVFLKEGETVKVCATAQIGVGVNEPGSRKGSYQKRCYTLETNSIDLGSLEQMAVRLLNI